VKVTAWQHISGPAGQQMSNVGPIAVTDRWGPKTLGG
jgi:hypothetical protein